MEPLFAAAPYTGYVYPDETVFPWGVLIVVYPYLTGLVAGAFTVSSLYQVFGLKQLRPVAHLALVTSLCCMIFVPLPLLLHLGHPERAFNAVFTPHWSSAMAMFGYFAGFYIILLVIETWFVFRPYIVQQAHLRKDLLGRLYYVACLGSLDLSEKAMRFDKKCIFALAILGIPGAHGLHGYVGFLFGSLKSREWWSSDLMPVIFLFSAIISGVALLVVIYIVSCKLRGVAIDIPCIKGMGYTLWGFVMFTLLLEGVEFGSLTYKAREGIDMILLFVTTRLVIPFFLLQFTIGAVVPILILSYMFWRGTTGKAFVLGILVSALLVMFNVIMMRFNVVIGGQEISKTGKGLLTFPWEFFGREGVLAAAGVLIAPFILLLVMVRLLPPWEDQTGHDEKALA
jgi:Ni/Fe-hydrogenase subunit HybB-like protein